MKYAMTMATNTTPVITRSRLVNDQEPLLTIGICISLTGLFEDGVDVVGVVNAAIVTVDAGATGGSS